MDFLCTGLLSRWNAEHPEDSVLPGDRVVKVNGEPLLGLPMVEKIKKAQLWILDPKPKAKQHANSATRIIVQKSVKSIRNARDSTTCH